ncbi:MAG: MFS transporter [Dehalococcoidia bacterium]|nr:MFS transporter [Dehalococcoidia bacterium]
MSPTRKYLIFSTLAVMSFTSAMQFYMVSIALPDLIEDLDAPLRWVSWVITGMSLSQAIVTPLGGKLADQIGKRRMYLGGLLGFILSSLVATIAPNIYVLIAARLVQGMAGGAMMPASTGIIASTFREDRVRMISMTMAIVPLGAVLGPNIGGFVVDQVGWRWTFGINVPIGLLLLIPSLLLLRNVDEPPKKHRLDLRGAVLLAFALGGLVYALTELARREPSPNMPVAVASLLIAAVAGVAFLRWELRAPEPVMDLRLFRDLQFTATLGLVFLYGIMLTGAAAYVPLFAESEYGLSTRQAAFILTPRGLILAATSLVTGFILSRASYRRPIAVGLAIFAIAHLVLALGLHDPTILGWQVPNFAYLTGVITFSAIGIGILNPSIANAGLHLLPDQIATVSGLRGMFSSLGGALGSAFVAFVTSRAVSTGDGLQTSYLIIGVTAVLSLLLLFGVPKSATATLRRIPPDAEPAARPAEMAR